MKTHSLKEPILSVLEESKKRDCRERLVEMYIALQPMTPVLARLTLKQFVTAEYFEPVYTIHAVNTEGIETKLGKDVFSNPSKKSASRNHKLTNRGEPSKYYKFNDDLTAAYCVMNEYASANGMTLTAATVTLDDEICLASKAYKRGIVACINERIKGDLRGKRKGWCLQALVVTEESDNSFPVKDELGNLSKRLHVHVLTLTSHETGEREEDLRLLLKRLGRAGIKNAVEVTTCYIAELPYTASIKLDEEFNGELPHTESASYANPERMGIWKGNNKSGYEVVFRRLPLNQRWADYMSKDISKDAQSKTFGMINGLGREVAKYKETKYLEGQAFKRIDFPALDHVIAQLNDTKVTLEISKVLEKYYKLVS
tara:strand:- start:17898 stop:19010 length:1113 start_codon:yes stop_codon:yes gene_type:complete